MLLDHLSDAYRRELADIRTCAEGILAEPLDSRFTDHTIKHKERILAHLDVLLEHWAKTQLAQDRSRAQAEIFILIAATYLHDIGMQMLHFERCPGVVDKLVTLGMSRSTHGQITEGMLEFARCHHHIITYDWLTNANLPVGRDIFPRTGLRTHIELVARVARAHNIWLTNKNSYQNYEHLVADSEEQEGKIRVCLLAAFLRMGDLLDMDSRRVDISKLQRYEISDDSKAHWWRHHFISTCRLDHAHNGEPTPLRLAFTLPQEHDDAKDWLLPALFSATVKEIECEQQRLSKWLGSRVWIDLPDLTDCATRRDVSGTIRPMPESVIQAFRRIWPSAEGNLVQATVSDALAKGKLDGDLLSKAIGPLEIRAEINDYLTQVKQQEERGFRDTPYTPIELDHGQFDDALDALEDLLGKNYKRSQPVVIVGDPGAGKTTLMRRYVLDCAKGERSSDMLPIYVPANRYGDGTWAEAMHTRLGSPTTPISDSEYFAILTELVERLLRLIAEAVCDLVEVPYHHATEVQGHMREIMARRSCLIVLDGLNEAPPSLRSLATLAVRAFVTDYPAHRVVVTSRIGDYHQDYFPTAPIHSLLPLKPEAIRNYWSELGIPNTSQSQVLDKEEMIQLATNPMYMYMMGELMRDGDVESLNHPGRLFRLFHLEGLRRWHRGHGNPLLGVEAMHQILACIAFQALEHQEVAFGRHTLEEAVKTWWKNLPAPNIEELMTVIARKAINTEENIEGWKAVCEEVLGVGLIRRSGSDEPPRYRFSHHTTQDYFAATFIASDTDRLPDLIPQAVFHEPLRLAVSLIDQPNDFLSRVIASTSLDVGRNCMLPLCFRIAGAMPERITFKTYRELFAAVFPIYHITITFSIPFGVELLAYLFSQLSWEALARFFGLAAENPHLNPLVREHARTNAIAVLNQQGRPTEAALLSHFDATIPAWRWDDYRHCKEVLLDQDGRRTGLRSHPLLLGGTAGSFSLSGREKLGIARELNRLTSNQIGALEMIFVDEIATFGGINLKGFEDKTLRLLLDSRAADLLLHKADARLAIGELEEAIDAYFERGKQIGPRYHLVQRLVHLSDQLDSKQRTTLMGWLESLAGTGCMIPDENDDSPAGMLARNPGLHPEIVAAMEALQANSNDMGLVLFCDLLLAQVRQHKVMSSERFDQLAAATDWSSPEGLILLDAIQAQSGIATKARELLDFHHPQRPGKHLDSWLDTLVKTNTDDLKNSLREGILSFGFQAQILTSCISRVLFRLPPQELDNLITWMEQTDRNLAWEMKVAALASHCKKGQLPEVEERMARWGITIELLTNHDDSERHNHEILTFLAEQDELEAVLSALGWPLFFQKNYSDRVLATNILEQLGRFQDAFETAIESLNLYQERRQEAAQSAYRISNKLRELEKSAENAVAAVKPLVDALLPLIKDRLECCWAFPMLEKMRKNGLLDLDSYAARCFETLHSPQHALASNLRQEILSAVSAIGRHDEVMRYLPTHLDRCPAEPAQAADYLGSTAWACYIAGADQLFADITEQALQIAPRDYQTDWLIANHALAALLLGDEKSAINRYQKAREIIQTKKRWDKAVMEDLHKHRQRRPETSQISPAFVEHITQLGYDLPIE